MLTRARVPADAADSFRTAADDLLALLAGLPGFVRGHLGRAADDQELWVVASARHVDLEGFAPAEYRNHVLAFMIETLRR